MNSTNLCASILISNSHCIVSRQERSFFLPWFIYLLYFPSYFLLALEWSCFINKFSFSSIFSLFLFVGSFLSAYKHVQVLLIKKKKNYSSFHSFVHPCIPSLLNVLKELPSHIGITSSLLNPQVTEVWSMPPLYRWSCSLKLIKALLVGESNN